MGMKISPTKDVDLSMFLSKNLFTGDINLVKSNSAISLSIKNLVLTILGRRAFNTNIGTNVYSSLFSMNIIPGKYNKDLIDLKNSMFFVLSNFEPRIEKIQINATSSVGKTLNFSITYTNKKTQEIQTLNITT
jgi:phage baseplate assembly protein W